MHGFSACSTEFQHVGRHRISRAGCTPQCVANVIPYIADRKPNCSFALQQVHRLHIDAYGHSKDRELMRTACCRFLRLINRLTKDVTPMGHCSHLLHLARQRADKHATEFTSTDD